MNSRIMKRSTPGRHFFWKGLNLLEKNLLFFRVQQEIAYKRWGKRSVVDLPFSSKTSHSGFKHKVGNYSTILDASQIPGRVTLR
ncbi:hypothetical protein AHMF7605_24305 [Adhaeribacter arboris]|uniref:Uncharacterized protein n=1 Tax=Adhaeribacter arboris TaxID=2072846 RepID=A0A2T2YLM9_9BACT|nr:hypothetical protein AHMF7605_24305 [Adhaeribacter arboris]